MIKEKIMNEIVCMVQDYSAKNGVHWLDTIEYIKEKLSSERAELIKLIITFQKNNNEIVSPNRYLDNRKFYIDTKRRLLCQIIRNIII